ncbi:MAG: glucose/sorbosone dehydrogenase, partial [Verrucomicrobiales bacterium]|nr:glucose/sorbosone dehydrogenase [Verrucomicrobiales bacterium]
EFDPNAPVNNSPNNTGPNVLPPARPAWIWYPYGLSAEFPEFGNYNSRTAFAGPVYHFDPNLNSSRKFPAYYDKTLFLFDMWRSGSMYEVKLDEQGAVLKINPFLKNSGLDTGPLDMEFGPDGSLYLIEWSPSSRFLTHIEYVAGNYSPVAVATASTNCGSTPLAVQFSGAASYAISTNPALTYAWSFRGNGIIDSTVANPSYTYTQAGNYNAQLTVTDAKGNTGVANLSMTVGNNRPVVTIQDPPNGAFFDWSQLIHYSINVSDVEDNPVACGEILAECWLGHNEHAHSQSQHHACSGLFSAPNFDPSEIGNLFLRFDASYNDHGAAGVSSLKGISTYTLQPKHKQAEYFSSASGVVRQATSDPMGGFEDVAHIDHGDWISFTPMNLTNISAVGVRAAGLNGGTVEIRADSPAGSLLGTINIPATGGDYTNSLGSVTNVGGTHELFFVFVSTPSASNLFLVNAIDFLGAGVTVPVILQSAGAVNGSFSDDTAAVIDLEAHIITVPMADERRFYRIRSTVPLHPTNVNVVNGKLVMSY